MALTRRDLLLALPGLVLAQRQAAPLSILGLHQVTLAVSDVARAVLLPEPLRHADPGAPGHDDGAAHR